MYLNKEEKCIYCHNCLKWLNINTEILLLDDINIVCIYCFPEHYIHLGYIWDITRWTDRFCCQEDEQLMNVIGTYNEQLRRIKYAKND